MRQRPTVRLTPVALTLATLLASASLVRPAAADCGVAWTSRAPGISNGLYAVGGTGSLIAAVGSSGAIVTSPDGALWIPRASGVARDLNAVAWTGSQLVVAGDGGTIVTSSDGLAWIARTSGTPSDLYAIAWTGSRLVAAGAGGTVVTSPDGVTWTSQQASFTVRGIAWTGSRLVAAGDAGRVAVSPDGLSWSMVASGTTANLRAIAWTGASVVAVGNAGTILTSADGTAWTSRSSGTSADLLGVAGSSSAVVAVGINGTIVASPDGTTWSARSSGTDANLLAIAAAGSQLVAVGCCSGTILTSPCTGSQYAYSTWVPVASHNPGRLGTVWRTDLGLLNAGTATANVQLKLYNGGNPPTSTSYVPAGSQSVLGDVVGQLGGSGSWALQVLSDQPLKITSRTYNQTAGGTYGQDYQATTLDQGLAGGQSAYLPQLTENAAARTNIGLVNTGAAAASVNVELHDGAGGLLATYTVTLNPGDWKQETQPFHAKAHQTAMDRGYAKVTVTSGSGVFALASLIDNATGDPTTIVMVR